MQGLRILQSIIYNLFLMGNFSFQIPTLLRNRGMVMHDSNVTVVLPQIPPSVNSCDVYEWEDGEVPWDLINKESVSRSNTQFLRNNIMMQIFI